MITLFWKDQEKAFTTKEEALVEIKSKLEEKVDEPQFAMIETEDNGAIEFAYGLDGKTVLFYIPESGEEDIRISCNETVDRAKSDGLKIEHPTEGEVHCAACNTVSNEEGMKVIEAFLGGEDFVPIVDWYCCL